MAERRPSDFLTNLSEIRAEAASLSADATRIWTLSVYAAHRDDVVEPLLADLRATAERLNAVVAKLNGPVVRFPRTGSNFSVVGKLDTAAGEVKPFGGDAA